MPSKLTLSIVTANYNNAPFLDDFFRSICESTCLPDELIFVDDASTDSSLIIAERWKKSAQFPIIIISLNKNIGFANSLNVGIDRARSDLILRIDPDDFINPNRIYKEKNILEINSDIHLVGSNTYYYNSKRGKVVGQSHLPNKHNDIVKSFKKGDIGICNGSYTARREIFQKIRYLQECIPFEEYDLFTRVIKSDFKVTNIPVALTYYRIHGQYRTFRFMLRKQKGLSKLRKMYFDTGLNSTTTYLKAASSFFYWRSLMAPNGFLQHFFLILSLPLKLNRLFSRISNRRR